jgi:hypothetical protein
MSDQRQRLNSSILELRRELAENEQLDPETRERLRGAIETLEEALIHEDEETLQHPSLKDTFRSTAVDFEDSHPTLTRIVGNLADILGNSGL